MVHFWFVNWAMVVGGIAVLKSGASAVRRYREVKVVPGGRVGEAPVGVSEVHGAVEGPPVHAVPLVGRRCVLWRCRFLGPLDVFSGKRVFDASLSEGTELVVVDDTGRAAVRAAGADVRGPRTARFRAADLSGAPGLEALLDRFRRERGGAPLPEPVRVDVAWVEPGDRVFVVGRITRRADPRGDLEGGYRGLPVMVHMEPGPWGPPIVSAVGGRRLRRRLRLEAAAKVVLGCGLVAGGMGATAISCAIP